MKLKTLFFLFFLLALVVFTLENAELITIRFLRGSFTASQALILISTLILGILIGKISRKNKK